MSVAKALLVFPAALLLAYAAFVGLIYFSQARLLYPGAIDAPAPEEAPWGESIRIDTPDGERLFALHHPADAGMPTLLFFPGNADWIGHYGFLADALAARGMGLLAISYRGYRGSSGSPGEKGLLVDGLAAFDWLKSQTDGPIVLLGQSLGSGVAVNTAAERPAAGVVLVSAYSSIEAVAAHHYPYLPVRLLIKDRFRSDLGIGGVAQPKLFIHGRRDDIIPLAFGEALFEGSPEPKRLLVYDARGHNDLWDEGMMRDVIGFVASLR